MFFPLTDKRVGDLDFLLLLKKAFGRRSEWKNKSGSLQNLYKMDTVNVKSAYRVPNRQLNIAVYGISVYRCITTVDHGFLGVKILNITLNYMNYLFYYTECHFPHIYVYNCKYLFYSL
jgi:hypothetical protein